MGAGRLDKEFVWFLVCTRWSPPNREFVCFLRVALFCVKLRMLAPDRFQSQSFFRFGFIYKNIAFFSKFDIQLREE